MDDEVRVHWLWLNSQLCQDLLKAKTCLNMCLNVHGSIIESLVFQVWPWLELLLIITLFTVHRICKIYWRPWLAKAWYGLSLSISLISKLVSVQANNLFWALVLVASQVMDILAIQNLAPMTNNIPWAEISEVVQSTLREKKSSV